MKNTTDTVENASTTNDVQTSIARVFFADLRNRFDCDPKAATEFPGSWLTNTIIQYSYADVGQMFAGMDAIIVHMTIPANETFAFSGELLMWDIGEYVFSTIFSAYGVFEEDSDGNVTRIDIEVLAQLDAALTLYDAGEYDKASEIVDRLYHDPITHETLPQSRARNSGS
jgi:hypothetical protein